MHTHKSKFSKMLAVMLAFVLTTGVFLSPAADNISITAYADDASDRDHEGKKNASEDVDFWNDINIDQSFEYQVRMATNYANRMAADGVKLGGIDGKYGSDLGFNNVAPFFGYTSGEINTDIVYSPSKSRGGNTSASSVSYSRALLRSYEVNNKAVSRYGDYGLLLNLMGFDNVGSAAENTRRSVLGVIALISYYAAGSVNSLFEIMFNILESTNPFQFFKDINISSTAGKAELEKISEGAIAASEGGDTALSTVTTYFGKVFNAFADFSWAVAIPMSLVLIIVAVFLTRNGRSRFGSNIKKFFIRIFFLILGIPILGSAYTQVLDALKDARVMSDDYITQAVSYTFLDFGEWVENRRLAPLSIRTEDISPFCIGTMRSEDDSGSGSDGSTIRLEGGDSYVAANTWFKLREVCSDLNVANGVFILGDKYLTVNHKTGAMLKDYMYSSTGATMATDDANTTIAAMNKNNKEAIIGVITKYMHGTKYTPEMFETGTIANMIAYSSGTEGAGKTSYGDMLALSCDKYSFSQNAERTIRGVQGKIDAGDIKYDPDNPKDAAPYSAVAAARFKGDDFANVGYNIWNNGNMVGNAWDESGGRAPNMKSSGSMFDATAAIDSPGLDRGLDPTQTTGLSTMSMYTYLTTQFTQDGLICYGDAPSDYTQTCHYAVNLIGGSYIMQVAFFANMITLLLSYFVMAFVFVFRSAFDILFKGIHLLGHTLLAAVGFYKSIGTAICMTVNMIAQLFVSVIFFSFVTDLMFIMTSLADHFFRKVAEAADFTFGSSTGVTSSASFQAEVLTITSSLLASLVIVFFVFFAIRWRAAIMAAINSTVETIVGSLLGVQLTGAADGGTSGMLKGALNDATNVAGVAATTAAGLGVVNGVQDMGDDIANSAAETFGSGDESPTRPLQGEAFDADKKSAVDGATAPSVGAGFDGGIGKTEGDGEVTRADTEELFANGLSGEHSSTGGHEAGGGGGAGNRDAGKDADSEGSASDKSTEENTEKRDYNDVGYHYGGSADGSIPAKDGIDGSTSVDKDGNLVLDRNGTGSKDAANSESGETGDGSGLEIGVNSLGGAPTKKNDAASSSAGASSDASASDKNKTGTDNAAGTAAQSSTDSNTAENNVTSSVGEDSQGTFWSQINPDTGTETTARFDMSRGLVIGMTDENGNVSDVAIGANGISTSTVDAAGNKQVTQLSEDGIQSTYTGVDGTTETVTADMNGADSSVKVNRTDANGNTEEIVTDMNGTTKSHTETAADGSTKTLTTDDAGNQTITEKNVATGYESVETISASGESTKTESVNGIKTVTSTDADGNLVSQGVTKLDANGNTVTTSYSVDDEGNVTSSVTSNGVTDKTIAGADGSRTEVQSVVRSDGSVVETTTEYGNDAVADSTQTVVKAANGTVIGTGNVTTGTDSTGEYTSSTVTTDKGSVEVKDYGGGHVVTTENANGVESVSEVKSDGSRTITETDTSTGNVRVATISASGTGETVLKNASGETISEEKITAGSDGTTSYTMMNGGTVTFSTVGEGAEKENVVAQTYAAGGQSVMSTNAKTGSQTVTSVDGLGGQNVVTTDAKTGDVTTEFKTASGNSGVSILSENGSSYQQQVNLAGGGTQTVLRTGTGADAVETVSKVDGAGNTMYQQSTGGRIDRIEATTGSNASFVQERGENGSVITHQVLESGAVINKTQQANGDYVQETVNANGSATYAESKGGVETVRNVSLTGIETTAMRNGSTSTETMNLEGISFSSSNNGQGANTTTFRTSTGQTYTMTGDGSGESKTIFETGDGNKISYKQNGDNSIDYIVRSADGSSRVENVAANGESKVVYYDTKGNAVDAPQGAATYNDSMAAAFQSFKAQNPNFSVPNMAASQRIVMPDFNAERQGSLNLSGGQTVDMSGINVNGGAGGYSVNMTGMPNVSGVSVNVPNGANVNMNGVSNAGNVDIIANGVSGTNAVNVDMPGSMNGYNVNMGANAGTYSVNMPNVGYTAVPNSANIVFDSQMPGNVQFDGQIPAGMTAAVPNGLGSNDVRNVDAESTTTFNVRAKHKTKISFLEGLFGGMINTEEKEEETVEETSSDDQTDGVRRALKNTAAAVKLSRNTGAGMGDYATRKTGSTTGNTNKK